MRLPRAPPPPVDTIALEERESRRGALASGFATAELHHHAGHDPPAGASHGAPPVSAGYSMTRPDRFEEQLLAAFIVSSRSRAWSTGMSETIQLGTRWRARRATREPSDCESGGQEFESLRARHVGIRRRRRMLPTWRLVTALKQHSLPLRRAAAREVGLSGAISEGVATERGMHLRT
jgi:hypothetical protein